MSFRKNFGVKHISNKNYLFDVVTLNTVKPIEPVKSVETQDKIEVNNNLNTPSNKVIQTEEYTVSDEDFLLIKNVEHSTVFLNKNSTNHIVIKSLTDTTIKFTDSKVDEEFDELTIGKGACVELYRFNDNWYVMSSDGVKSD
jgi:hypothetical protein